ncbi:Iduronate 2-sulfatase, partial [Pseudolycoriella hygida]
SARNNNRRNVLLIVCDDLRFLDRDAITPNIDKYSKISLNFKHAYAQQALCAPSRNSFLTSRRPDTLRLFDFNNYWRTFVGNFTTLPQYLKSHNYFTHSIGKIFHPGVSSNFNDDYPLSWSRKPYHPPSEKYMNKRTCPQSGELRKNIFCPVHVKYQPMKTLPDIQSINTARRFLQTPPTRPFFLSVGLHKPHIPFRFPSKYLKYHPLSKFTKPEFNYIPHDLPTVAFNPFNDIRKRDDAISANISFPFGPIPNDFGLRIRQGYYASVTYMDSLIGRLLKEVDWNNTVVALIGDHGWSTGNHGMWAKYSNFDVAVRVPMIIYSPDLTRDNHHVSDNVELLDLFPTIVDLIGLPPLRRCTNKNEILCTEGRSLKNYFDFTFPNKETFAFSQYPRPGPYPSKVPNTDEPKLHEIKIMGCSVKTSRFRYTLWVGYNSTTFTKDFHSVYGEELYDHSIDPDENMNLALRGQFKDLKDELLKLLKINF